MSNTVAVDWQLIVDKPSIVRQIERPTTAKPSKYRQYAQIANALANHVDQHWDNLDESIRHALRVTVSCTLEPNRVFSQLEVFSSTAAMMVAFLMDREAVLEWSSAVKRARASVLNAMERENEEYGRILSSALSEVTNRDPKSPTMTAQEASAFIRSL